MESHTLLLLRHAKARDIDVTLSLTPRSRRETNL
jgi:hypothetical protein